MNDGYMVSIPPNPPESSIETTPQQELTQASSFKGIKIGLDLLNKGIGKTTDAIATVKNVATDAYARKEEIAMGASKIAVGMMLYTVMAYIAYQKTKEIPEIIQAKLSNSNKDFETTTRVVELFMLYISAQMLISSGWGDIQGGVNKGSASH